MDRKTISKIVKASGISSGELILVHFWGEDADKEIANNFMAAVAEIGATPVLLQQSRSVNRDIFLAAKESCYEEKYFDLFSSFDAVLDVFAYRPVILGYEIDNDKFELYRRYMAQLFSKLMTCRRFTQIRIPTEANAEESGLNPQDYIQRMERAYDIDYPAVYEACRQAKDRFEGAGKVLLRTGEDCELSFELTGRAWHIDAGDGDLPCGERSLICTAEHIICADCNVKCAAHFFIQNSIAAQIRYIGVHAKAKLANNPIFLRLLLEKGSDFRLAAAAYPSVPDMQQNMLIFNAVKVKNFKINSSLRFVRNGRGFGSY